MAGNLRLLTFRIVAIIETWQNIFPRRRSCGGHFDFEARHATFSCGILVLILFAVQATLVAQDDAPQDAEGCKDSAIITRMPGSTIHSCENKEFEQVKVPV